MSTGVRARRGRCARRNLHRWAIAFQFDDVTFCIETNRSNLTKAIRMAPSNHDFGKRE
jgi:hypothetical protein